MATPFTVYKLIILYMLRNSSSPITNSEISEFILDREYTNYFHLQQALSELEETELIEKRTIPILPTIILLKMEKTRSPISRMIFPRTSVLKCSSTLQPEVPPQRIR